MLRTTVQRFLFAFLVLAPATIAAAHDGHHAPTTVPVSAHGSARLDQLQLRLATNPTDALLLSQVGAEHLALAKRSASHPQYRAAENAYRSWLALETGSAAAHFGLSYALLGQHRFAEALEHGRSAATLQPGELQVWALLGDLHFALGNYVEADFAYRALEQDALDLFSLSRRAQMAAQRGELARAIELYDDALEAGQLLEEPASAIAWCHTMLGDLRLDCGDLVAAEGHYVAARDLQPGMHAARFRIAKVEIVEGHGDHALPMLEALVGEHPLPRYRLQLGRLLRARGQTADGQAWIDGVETEILAELASGDMGHVRELAELYLHEETHLDRALELAQLDLDRIRHDAGTYETLAWAQHMLGLTNEARANITRALASGASSTRLLSRAAQIQFAADNAAGARRLLQLARARDGLLAAEHAAEPNRSVAQAFDAPHMRWVLSHLE